MFKFIIGTLSLIALPSLAYGEAVKSVVTASNGVEVTVYSDDFANRKEFSAPSVKVENGQVLVAAINKGGLKGTVELTGFFIYSGEWRRYNSALYKGGDAAKFVSTGRDVGRCSSSRYSRPSCTLTENFVINISPSEIKAHDVGGIVAIQVRAEDTSTAIFEVPTAYIKAVAEVAQIDFEPPVPVVARSPASAAPGAAKPTKAQPRHTTGTAKRRK